MILSYNQKAQAADFCEAILPTKEAMIGGAIEYIKEHFAIEDIFDDKAIDELCEEWAKDNGWTKPE